MDHGRDPMALMKTMFSLSSNVSHDGYRQWKIKLLNHLRVHSFHTDLLKNAAPAVAVGDNDDTKKEKRRILQQEMIVSAYIMGCCDGNKKAERILFDAGEDLPKPFEILRKFNLAFGARMVDEAHELRVKVEMIGTMSYKNGSDLIEQISRLITWAKRIKVTCINEDQALFKARIRLATDQIYSSYIISTYANALLDWGTFRDQIERIDHGREFAKSLLTQHKSDQNESKDQDEQKALTNTKSLY